LADLQEAQALAQALDLWHLVIETHEVEDPAYRANGASRCFVCKRELFTELETLAAAEGIATVLYGAIGEDQLETRPGQRAAAQFGVRAPLQEAGLAKWEIRELARALGLPNWDRPQNACLSSRVPHGRLVNEQTLRQVETAEAFLRAQGFRQVRVRHLGAHARIEIEPDQLARFQDDALRRRTLDAFIQAGFSTVAVDRRGYHPGGADHHTDDEFRLV